MTIALCKNKCVIQVELTTEINLEEYKNKNVFILRDSDYLTAGILLHYQQGIIVVYTGNKPLAEFTDSDDLYESGSIQRECIENSYIALVPEITHIDSDEKFKENTLNLLTYNKYCEYYTSSRILYKTKLGYIATSYAMYNNLDKRWVNFNDKFNEVDINKFNFIYNIDFMYKNNKIKAS